MRKVVCILTTAYMWNEGARRASSLFAKNHDSGVEEKKGTCWPQTLHELRVESSVAILPTIVPLAVFRLSVRQPIGEDISV